MTDYDLERSVADELQWDPKLDSKAVAVSSYNGEVTLRGTVGSFREKRDAEKATQRVRGVRSVINRLEVRPLSRNGRDAELRTAVLRALRYDSLIPATIDAAVENGRVTLTGTAGWQHQRDEANYVAGNVAACMVWTIGSNSPGQNRGQGTSKRRSGRLSNATPRSTPGTSRSTPTTEPSSSPEKCPRGLHTTRRSRPRGLRPASRVSTITWKSTIERRRRSRSSPPPMRFPLGPGTIRSMNGGTI